MRPALAVLALCVGVTSVAADSSKARCEIDAKGTRNDVPPTACTFYQAQGHVVVTFADGREFDFTPAGEGPGTFTDPNGRPVYRRSGLGDEGVRFLTPEGLLSVYWGG